MKRLFAALSLCVLSCSLALAQPPAVVRAGQLSQRFVVTDMGGDDAYVGDPVAGGCPGALTAGLTVDLIVSTTNTGAATLNFCGLGALEISSSPSGTDLNNGDLVVGKVWTLTWYDSSPDLWLVTISLPLVGRPIYGGCTSAVGTDSYACTGTAPTGGLAQGTLVSFIADVANDDDACFNLNGIGCRVITKASAGIMWGLLDNDIIPGEHVLLVYDGSTYWQCLSCYRQDFAGMTGAVTDAQVPNNITVDLATAAQGLAVTPTLCPSGQSARGVVDSGNATGCFVPGSNAFQVTVSGNVLTAAGGKLGFEPSGTPATYVLSTSTITKTSGTDSGYFYIFTSGLNGGAPTFQCTHTTGITMSNYTLSAGFSEGTCPLGDFEFPAQTIPLAVVEIASGVLQTPFDQRADQYRGPCIPSGEGVTCGNGTKSSGITLRELSINGGNSFGIYGHDSLSVDGCVNFDGAGLANATLPVANNTTETKTSGRVCRNLQWLTPSALLDLIGSTRGSILYRGSGGWAIMTPGTTGYVLTSQGAGADPVYAASSAVDIFDNTAIDLPDYMCIGKSTTDEWGLMRWKDISGGGTTAAAGLGMCGIKATIAVATAGPTTTKGIYQQSAVPPMQVNFATQGNFDVRFTIRTPSSLTNSGLYCGAGQYYPDYANSVRFKYVQGTDTVWKFEAEDGGGTTPVSSTITVAPSTTYVLRFHATTAGTLYGSVNGESDLTIATHIYNGPMIFGCSFWNNDTMSTVDYYFLKWAGQFRGLTL